MSVSYFAIVNEVKRRPHMVLGFVDLGRRPGGQHLERAHQNAFVCPVSRNTAATERFFAAWTPVFQDIVDELPDDLGITVIECASEAQWLNDKRVWVDATAELGLPKPVWLYDSKPDFDRLVGMARSMQNSDWTTGLGRRILGALAEDAGMKAIERVLSRFF